MHFRMRKDLKIDESLRRELSKPFGKVLTSKQIENEIRKSDEIYAVGDVTVATLLKLGYVPKVAIFDYRTERSRVVFSIIRKKYRRPIKVKNSRGMLSISLWNAVKKAANSKRSVGIRVNGEEDLGSLACIHFAKDGSKIMYGLRNRGVVMISANNRIKSYIKKTLRRMDTI